MAALLLIISSSFALLASHRMMFNIYYYNLVAIEIVEVDCGDLNKSIKKIG
ncbi:hypothetical protein Lalb_Chr25g0288801 [Lupinus albus]|uniref:Uncharacterized protein n=1 Tax=Lupinus albus TaxID=3870 RepID=A0A6A4ND91_LUPAL|nr:hypothetical protein Lalb_Chr25g0288801 [Lupinus albus]